MKQLIINADDLGADEGRNVGIFDAIRVGAVTSASILANGPALEDGLERIRCLEGAGVSFGVHVNLSEGRPLSPGLRLLSGPDGCFLGKTAARRLLASPVDETLETEIDREVRAQVLLLKDCGIRIRHLDGHQHVHVFPAVVRVAVEAARHYGIPWMRMPIEPCPLAGKDPVPDDLAEEARFFFERAKEARPILEGNNINSPDHFCGLYWKGRLSLPLLEKFLTAMPTGLTEFMVHPGRVWVDRADGPFSAFSIMEREEELNCLLDPRFRIAVKEARVTLTPFPEFATR